MALVLASCLSVPALAGDEPRGARLFARYCVLCHGAMADGNGPLAAAIQGAKPANLRRSPLSPEEKSNIIRRGGAAVGRSGSMPAWQQELDDEDIAALLEFLAGLAAAPPMLPEPRE